MPEFAQSSLIINFPSAVCSSGAPETVPEPKCTKCAVTHSSARTPFSTAPLNSTSLALTHLSADLDPPLNCSGVQSLAKSRVLSSPSLGRVFQPQRPLKSLPVSSAAAQVLLKCATQYCRRRLEMHGRQTTRLLWELPQLPLLAARCCSTGWRRHSAHKSVVLHFTHSC